MTPALRRSYYYTFKYTKTPFSTLRNKSYNMECSIRFTGKRYFQTTFRQI